jgi:hypothetical protein
MKPLSRQRATKNLPPAVTDLVAEGGNVLSTDDAKVLPIAPAKVVQQDARSNAKPRIPRARQRTAASH